MKTILSHLTALEALRSQNLRSRLAKGERCDLALPTQPPDAGAAKDLVLEGLTAPVEVLLANNRVRRRNELVRTHAAPSYVPSDSFVYLGEGVYCVVPELLAVQLASQLTRLELIVLLSELMGFYAIAPSVKEGMFARRQPLTTPQRIEAYLDALGPISGTRLVREALKYACVGSASPRETKLSLRLGLKPAMGGYGLEVLSMNDPVEVQRIHDVMQRGIRKPDILLKAHDPQRAKFAGVAAEYNGAYHNDAQQRGEDDLRANELLALDFKEYVINKSLYANLDYMDGIAERMRKDLGYPPLRLSHAEAVKRRKSRVRLYEELERIDGVHWSCLPSSEGPREYEYVPIEAYEYW